VRNKDIEASIDEDIKLSLNENIGLSLKEDLDPHCRKTRISLKEDIGPSGPSGPSRYEDIGHSLNENVGALTEGHRAFTERRHRLLTARRASGFH
jgi:hypothetical protein